MVNTHLFKFYVAKNNDTVEQLAKYLSISRTTLSSKINNKGEFKHSEILKIIKKYKLNTKDIALLFGDVNDC